MTSRNLFFKLMREDMKRKLWAFGLSFLAFFFWMPVAGAMRLTDLAQQYNHWIINGTTFNSGITAEIKYQQELADIVISTIGMENYLAALSIGTAALVMALTGFMYLHSNKQMDFYHSIPVRRETIFAVKYLNGILIVLSMYVVNLLFAYLVLGMNGAEISTMLQTSIPALLVHISGYLIIYGLMTIAVVLTGNFFISILGGIVLFSYVPAVIALVQGLMHLFFETVNTRGIDLDQMMLKSSPISYYANALAEGVMCKVGEYGPIMDLVAIAVLAGIVFAFIAGVLYKKRPSEAAGKAMAFGITKAPIRIMLVVPVTICASVFFWNIYYSLPWAVFGFVFGLGVTHCLIEIIYHFEFRKLFANLPHMAISAMIAVLIIAVFRFDLFGYDSYLPKESELKSASIYVRGLRDWNEYGLPEKMERGGYSWNYMSESDYIANHMKITDQEVVFALADVGIDNALKDKAEKFANNKRELYDESWTDLTIGYELNNGKKVYRDYRVSPTGNRDLLDRLYANEDYKAGVSPIMQYDHNSIFGIYASGNNGIQEVEANETMSEAILNAYKKDYVALTLEERFRETPITSLRFLTKGELEYLKEFSREVTSNYTGSFRLEDMNDVNFFPVYPSYENTLALLKECGIDDFEKPSIEEVQRIEIINDYYQEGGESGITLTNFDDPIVYEQANEVLNQMVNLELSEKNSLYEVDHGIRILVYGKTTNEDRSADDQQFIRFVFPMDRIPGFVNEKFKLAQVEYREKRGGF